tara:strand:+ start:2814 stop:3647 length:834 start_codon:yes stop_codon:yes gene_type:complete
MKSILIKTYKKIRFIIYSILKISLNKSELQGELNYFTFLKFKYSYIMDLPFNVGRTNRGLNFDNNEYVFTGLVKDLVNRKNKSEIKRNLFQEFKSYKNLKVLDINEYMNNSILKSFPIWNMFAPWEKIDKSNLDLDYLKRFYKNRQEHKLNFESENPNEILKKIYSKQSALSQLNQYENLYKKIKKEGYVNDYKNLPTAVILIDQEKWVWMIQSGNHRAYLKKEMGDSFIKCEILDIIKLEKMNKCYNVKNNIFSNKEAISFFKRVFEGKIVVRGVV